jgi:hypothetical protein
MQQLWQTLLAAASTYYQVVQPATPTTQLSADALPPANLTIVFGVTGWTPQHAILECILLF